MQHEVLVVDDHPLFRAALMGAVASACRECEFREADSVATLFDTLDERGKAARDGAGRSPREKDGGSSCVVELRCG